MKYALDVCLLEWSFRTITRVIAILAFIAVCSAASIAPQPTGELVDIGGRKLHIHCTGNAARQ